MADNLTLVKTTVANKITNAGGSGTILAIDHKSILDDVLDKVGKYTGSIFKARSTPVAGVVPTGVMFFNGNALNTTTDFLITFAKNSFDLNDVSLYLNRLKQGDLIHFKDFSGRSVYFIYKSHVANTDSGGADIFDVTVAGFAENTNYTYIISDDEISAFEFISGDTNVIPFGDLIRHKASGNVNFVISESGDINRGKLNGEIFLNFGVYVSGPELDLTSYDPASVDSIDLN